MAGFLPKRKTFDGFVFFKWEKVETVVEFPKIVEKVFDRVEEVWGQDVHHGIPDFHRPVEH